MKIAILCLAIYAYVVYASEDRVDGETKTKQGVYDAPHYNQGYFYYNANRATVVRPRRTQRSQIGLLLLFLVMSREPATTTATTDTVTTVSTTRNPLEGWKQIGDDNCYYILSSTTATWDDADDACKGLIDGGRLAVVGFNKLSDERTSLIEEVGATGTTFWIGVKGVSSLTNGFVQLPQFIAPLDGLSALGSDTLFVASIADGSPDGTIICARVGASDPDDLKFEKCAVESRRYMCEHCV